MAETPDSERAQTGIGGSGTLHDQDHDQDDGEQPPALGREGGEQVHAGKRRGEAVPRGS
jgi:hypothetical protein